MYIHYKKQQTTKYLRQKVYGETKATTRYETEMYVYDTSRTRVAQLWILDILFVFIVFYHHFLFLHSLIREALFFVVVVSFRFFCLSVYFMLLRCILDTDPINKIPSALLYWKSSQEFETNFAAFACEKHTNNRFITSRSASSTWIAFVIHLKFHIVFFAFVVADAGGGGDDVGNRKMGKISFAFTSFKCQEKYRL